MPSTWMINSLPSAICKLNDRGLTCEVKDIALNVICESREKKSELTSINIVAALRGGSSAGLELYVDNHAVH